jgi:hypothetical protein
VALSFDDYALVQDLATKARGQRVTSDSAAMISESMAASAERRSGKPRRRRERQERDRLTAGPDARHEEV